MLKRAKNRYLQKVFKYFEKWYQTYFGRKSGGITLTYNSDGEAKLTATDIYAELKGKYWEGYQKISEPTLVLYGGNLLDKEKQNERKQKN